MATPLLSGGGGNQNIGDERDRLHETGLDTLTFVNLILSGVMFIGLNFSDTSSTLEAGDPCAAPASLIKWIVLLEVLAFAFYMLSGLIAQGIKLQLNLKYAGMPAPTDQDACAQFFKEVIIPFQQKIMRFGMRVTAAGTLVGTIFLTLSIVAVIEVKLGLLTCSTSHWSLAAVIPLVICVFVGISTVVSTAFYDFNLE